MFAIGSRHLGRRGVPTKTRLESSIKKFKPPFYLWFGFFQAITNFKNTEMFAIYVGDQVNNAEINGLKSRVSEPIDKHFFRLDNIDFAPTITGEIAQRLCTSTTVLPCCAESLTEYTVGPGDFKYFEAECSDTNHEFIIEVRSSVTSQFEVYVVKEMQDKGQLYPGPLDHDVGPSI